MTTRERTVGEEIRITAADGGAFAGYLALPSRVPGPGLIVLPEVFNTNAHIRSVADGYAAEGFVALAPDVYWRQEARSYLPYTDEGRAKAQSLRARLDTDQFTRDLGRRHRRAAGAPGMYRQGRGDGVLPGWHVRLPGQHAAADRSSGQLLRRADRSAPRRGRSPQVPDPDALRRERSACAGVDRGGDPGADGRIEAT